MSIFSDFVFLNKIKKDTNKVVVLSNKNEVKMIKPMIFSTINLRIIIILSYNLFAIYYN